MKVSQVYEILNTMTKEHLGLESVVNEDLSNVVDIGREIISSDNLDNFVRKLPDVIGRYVMVDRTYSPSLPSIMRDGWEYGAILAKYDCEIPEAEENESWELTNGTSYDPHIFTKPDVSVRFYSDRVTYEIPMSFAERQVKSAFDSATSLNAFFSMIRTKIENSVKLKNEELSKRLLLDAAAETVYSDYSSADLDSKSGVKAVNLLYLYNQRATTPIYSLDTALETPAFLKFAAATIGEYVKNMSTYSTLFNIGEKARFTPSDRLSLVLLDRFRMRTATYLESDTFHKELVALPNSESVTFWQGSGTAFATDDISNINVKTSGNNTLDIPGVLGMAFDRDAVALTNENARTTSIYNPKAEFWNEWHKWDAGLFRDPNENFVVFFAYAQES